MIGDTRYRITVWGKTGAYKGAKSGFKLACGYMFVTTLVMAFVSLLGLVAYVVSKGNAEPLIGIVAGIMFLFLVWFVGFIIGVLPATVVGAVIGGIVGSVVAFPSIYDSAFLRRTVSVGTVLLVVLLAANPLFEAQNLVLIEVLSNPSFWYFVGVPFLFCLGTMVWLSDRLPMLATTSLSYETIAGERPVLPPLWLD